MFFKKKKDVKAEKPSLQPIEPPVKLPEEKPSSEKRVEESEERKTKPSFAPLFVKLDKYKSILSTINNLRANLLMLKNSLQILSELEKLREDNLKLISENVKNLERRIAKLDSDFLRPSGFHEQLQEIQDIQSIEGTIIDLKTQIERLRAELERIV